MAGLISVCVWLSLVGLARDQVKEKTGDMMRRTSRQQIYNKEEQRKLVKKEQARRVKHVQDICHDWGDAKHSIHKVRIRF